MSFVIHFNNFAAFDRDYHEVCQSLINLRQHGDLHVTALGIALGLSYQTVLGMGNGDDFLNQIIAAWLKRQDNVLSQSGEPAWSVLADKLEEIGCSEIAADIQREHDGPQRESEWQGGNPPTLSTDLSDLLNQLNSRNLSGHTLDAPQGVLDQSIVPTSLTQSKQQDQPRTR